MYYTLNVSAIELLDNVSVSLTVREWGETYETGPEPVLRHELTLLREEVVEPRQWASDVLVGLLETL